MNSFQIYQENVFYLKKIFQLKIKLQIQIPTYKGLQIYIAKLEPVLTVVVPTSNPNYFSFLMFMQNHP